MNEVKVQLEETEHRKWSAAPGCPLRSGLLLLLTLLLSATTVLVLHTHGQEVRQEDDGYDLHHSLRQISNVRAAIHLEGQYNPELQQSVEWHSHVDQAHAQGGLRLVNNTIQIPRGGLYFVYSQASFRVDCSRGGGREETALRPLVHLSHAVQRRSSQTGYDDATMDYVTIMHGIRTACQRTHGSEGSWFSTVYMGAVFNLSHGDRLRTFMEDAMLKQLDDDPGKTFFGVFAL